MSVLLKEIPLPNGLTVHIRDCTHRYYGDFHLVKIEIDCEVPVRGEYFEDDREYRLAREMLGEVVTYRRNLEHMGVPSTGIDRAREILMRNFIEHSLPYFSTASFPAKFVLSRFRKESRRLARQLC